MMHKPQLFIRSYKPGVGNLFTIAGRMNCTLSLASRKIN